MNPKSLFILAAVLGIGVGVAATAVEFGGRPSNPLGEAAVGGAPAPATGRPRLVIENDGEVEGQHDFGVMQPGEQRSHTFILKNAGQGVLTLDLGKKSCTCTVSKLEKTRLRPGESTSVKLTWPAKQNETEIRQTVLLKTNDPGLPETHLAVVGKVYPAIRPEVERIVLTSVRNDRPTTARCRVYGYTQEPLTITSRELVGLPAAEHFDLRVEPLPREELAEEEHATSGWDVILTTKPGLPLGRIRQTIRLTTDAPSVAPQTIPVEGRVVGDVTITGDERLNQTDFELSLGIVKENEGAQADLRIEIRGGRAEQVEVKIGSVTPPDVLRAELGARRVENGVATYPLTVRVPAGVRPGNYIGQGVEDAPRITIETTHPHCPRVPLYVPFAVRR